MSGQMLEGQSQVHYERVVRMVEMVLGLLFASLQYPIWYVLAVVDWLLVVFCIILYFILLQICNVTSNS